MDRAVASTRWGVRRALAAGGWACAGVLGVVLGGVGSAHAQAEAPAPVRTAQVVTPQVQAELVAHAPQGLAPGRPMWLGLRLQHQPHWHTYWQNPGDSGMATTLQWTLPAGASAGPVAWPMPQRLPIGPLVNHGYEGTLLLPVPLHLDTPPAAPVLRVALHAEWLVCQVECIPQSGDFELALPVRAGTVAHRQDFERAWAAHPATLPTLRAEARIEADALAVQVHGLDAGLRGRPATVFPELAGVLENAAPAPQAWTGEVFRLRWPLAAQRSESPPHLPLVLGFDGSPPLRVVAVVQDPWPGTTAPATPVADPPAAAAVPLGAAAALGLAFLGGLLLNLMPCVFPVLAVKVLALAQPGLDARARTLAALAYSLGVVASFLALAGLLLVLRAGGQQLGWGFQLQAPPVVAGLAVLFALIALNLSGVFEFGALLPARLAGLRLRHPALDAGLTGVLAVAVASPCTAPFMGVALGAALTGPPAQALAVFLALGLGMALPTLLLVHRPAALRRLPRPGPWMQHLKAALAFPMWATVVWLTWVLGQQTGIDGAAALLALLVLVALAAWLWNLRPPQGLARSVLAGAAAALLVTGWVWAAPLWRAGTGAAGLVADARWQPWSAARLQALRAEGRTVFVDFTAAWCVTCQINKRGALADAGLLADLDARQVVLLRADWTSRDPAIAAELARLQRSGVPTYALYRGQAAPQLLSEILTVQEVRSALSTLPSGVLP